MPTGVDLPVLKHPQLTKIAQRREAIAAQLAEARATLTALAQAHHARREAGASTETTAALVSEMMEAQAAIEDLTNTAHELRAEYRAVAWPIQEGLRGPLQEAYCAQATQVVPYLKKAQEAMQALTSIAKHAAQQGIALQRCDTPVLQQLLAQLTQFLARQKE
jgi:hypothetical protein